MDHHGGTTICRSIDIWHTSHYMYLIIRVISKQPKNTTNNRINSEKALLEYHELTTQKGYDESIYLRLNINYIM